MSSFASRHVGYFRGQIEELAEMLAGFFLVVVETDADGLLRAEQDLDAARFFAPLRLEADFLLICFLGTVGETY